jgi:soluble lytic murein transglycosylase-like protein
MITLEAWILALCLQIAPQYGVPPYLAAAVIQKESRGEVEAVSRNRDGTFDRGLMQLNSSWFKGAWHDPVVNVTEGCALLAQLYKATKDCSPNWFDAVIAYNCGLTRFRRGPPAVSVEYAYEVCLLWAELDPWNPWAFTDPHGEWE